MLQVTTKIKREKIIIFIVVFLLNLILVGCSNHLAQNRTDYFTWATHQHRQFEQEETSLLPSNQYISCGTQKYPCKSISKIYVKRKHQRIISGRNGSKNRENS